MPGPLPGQEFPYISHCLTGIPIRVVYQLYVLIKHQANYTYPMRYERERETLHLFQPPRADQMPMMSR